MLSVKPKRAVTIAVVAALSVVATAFAASGEETTSKSEAVINRVESPLPAIAWDLSASTENEPAAMRFESAEVDAFVLPESAETVWLSHGQDGSTCLIEEPVAGRVGALCSHGDGGVDGLTLIRPPTPSRAYVRAAVRVQESGLRGDAAREALARATRGLAGPSGPATYLGYIPDSAGVTSARLVDENSKALDVTGISNGLYQLRVNEIRADMPVRIELVHEGGGAPTVIEPLPGLGG